MDLNKAISKVKEMQLSLNETYRNTHNENSYDINVALLNFKHDLNAVLILLGFDFKE